MTARPILIALLSLALATAAVAGPALGATGSDAGPTAQIAKKCKHGKTKKGKCKKRPNPYVEGQPCDPAKDEAYAKYGYLCLPQPQPDGTSPYLLVKSLA